MVLVLNTAAVLLRLVNRGGRFTTSKEAADWRQLMAPRSIKRRPKNASFALTRGASADIPLP